MIPEWLQNSSLGRTLTDEFDKKSSIEFKYYRETPDINTISDFTYMLNLLEYWMVDTIPLSIFKYYLDHKQTVVSFLKLQIDDNISELLISHLPPETIVSPNNSLFQFCIESSVKMKNSHLKNELASDNFLVKCKKYGYWNGFKYYVQNYSLSTEEIKFVLKERRGTWFDQNAIDGHEFLLPYCIRRHYNDVIIHLLSVGCVLRVPSSAMKYCALTGNLEILRHLVSLYGIHDHVTYNARRHSIRTFHECIKLKLPLSDVELNNISGQPRDYLISIKLVSPLFTDFGTSTFPRDPVNGQLYTYQNVNYIFKGESWEVTSPEPEPTEFTGYYDGYAVGPYDPQKPLDESSLVVNYQDNRKIFGEPCDIF